jgi:hypothetical protein
MSATFVPANIPANAEAKEVLARLKSGVPLDGTVRSHSMEGGTAVAWVAIRLPAVGDRQVLVRDVPQLQPGQSVVIQCVPNPSKPEHYIFHLAGESHEELAQ